MSETFSFDPVYEEAISALISLESPELLDNNNISHARSLIRALVSKVAVDRYIGIFTGSLCEEAFGPSEQSQRLRSVLIKKFKLKLLFHKHPDEALLLKNSFYAEVVANPAYKNLIEVKCLDSDQSNEDKKHLLTVSNKAFRIELDQKKQKLGQVLIMKILASM